MKKIMASLFCMIAFLLLTISLYVTKTVRVEIELSSDKAAVVRLFYTQSENDTEETVVEKEAAVNHGQNVFFDLPVERLYRMKLSILQTAESQKMFQIGKITVKGTKTVSLSPFQDSVSAEQVREITFKTPFDIAAKDHVSFFAVTVLALFSFLMAFLVFSFKTVAVLAAAMTGYFCFSFYLNINPAQGNAFFGITLLFGLFWLYHKTYIHQAFYPDVPLLILSFALAVINAAAFSMDYADSFALITKNQLFAVTAVAGETILFYTAAVYFFRFLECLGTFQEKPTMNRLFLAYEKHTVLISFAVIFLCWTVLHAVYSPGIITIDLANQIKQQFGMMSKTQHHPFLSTFLIGLCYRTGGIYLYILMQSAVCAFVFALCLDFIKQTGMPRLFSAVTLLFFSVVPFGLFAVWGIKDVLYSGFFTLFVLQTAQLLYNKKATGRQTVLYAVTALLVCLLRNNGVYAVIPTLLFLATQKQFRSHAIGTTLAVLTVFLTLTKFVFPAMGYPEGSKKEMFSIPFQQTARYAKHFPDEITPVERTIINKVLHFNQLADSYSPRSSDPVKKTYKPNRRKNETAVLVDYFAVWGGMFLKHPLTYIQSFLAGSSQYYTFIPYAPSLPLQGISPQDLPGNFEKQSASSVRDFANTVFYRTLWVLPFLYVLYNCAFYTFLMLLVAFYALRCGRKELFFVLIPVFVSILVCIAAPVNGLLRYIMPVISVFPLVLAMTRDQFLLDKDKNFL